ncbi:conserved hypothetical protein [Ricinus communis]|uniref:Flotillin-like n=1 Tax=Ricinus communis TaxID=3988 RepID=B9SWT0_RICCO|nr:conserved hypothetical protein [Ricinus communis]
MSPHDRRPNHVNELVQGVIEGETRVLAASMTMEDIFKGTKEFKQEYFSYLGQRTQMEAANQAKVDVAAATIKSETGAKIRQGETAQNAAKIDGETKIISVQRQGEGQKEEIKVKTEVKIFQDEKDANAELATKKAGWAEASKLAEVEAAKAVAIREAEVQSQLETKNALARTEKLKAELLSRATVQEANWEMYKKQREVDAVFYEKQKNAEAQKANADAAFYARQQAADGELYAKKKESEAIQILAQAQGVYLATLLKQLGGNYAALRDYIMLDKNLFQEIANINASAVKGLQPKMSIWNNGVNGGEQANGGAGDPVKDIAGVYGMLPPLLQTVHEQTGMLPPAWLGTLTENTCLENTCCLIQID